MEHAQLSTTADRISSLLLFCKIGKPVDILLVVNVNIRNIWYIYAWLWLKVYAIGEGNCVLYIYVLRIGLFILGFWKVLNRSYSILIWILLFWLDIDFIHRSRAHHFYMSLPLWYWSRPTFISTMKWKKYTREQFDPTEKKHYLSGFFFFFSHFMGLLKYLAVWSLSIVNSSELAPTTLTCDKTWFVYLPWQKTLKWRTQCFQFSVIFNFVSTCEIFVQSEKDSKRISIEAFIPIKNRCITGAKRWNVTIGLSKFRHKAIQNCPY